MSLLWGLVNSLMIIAYFPLLNIRIPSNVLQIDNVFYQIATFDLIPMDWVLEMLQKLTADFEREEPLELHVCEQVQDQGYDTSNPIYNCIDAIVLFLIGGLVALLLKLDRFIGQRFDRVRNVVKRIEKQMYWNLYIRLGIEEFQVISIGCLIKLYALDFSNVFESLFSIVGILGMALVILAPLVVWHQLSR